MNQNPPNTPNVNYGYAQPVPTPQGANVPPAPAAQAAANQRPLLPSPAAAPSPMPNQPAYPAYGQGVNYANAPPAPGAQAGVNQMPTPPSPAVAVSPMPNQPAYPAYGQPPPSPLPPYSPQQQYPVSPNDAGQYPQPNEAPVATATPQSPKRDCLCAEFTEWVKVVPTLYVIGCVLLLIYFIYVFSSSKVIDCDEYNNDASSSDDDHYSPRNSRFKKTTKKPYKPYTTEDVLKCAFRAGGTFGWLVPLLIFNLLDALNAYRVKSVCWFRVSGAIWAFWFVIDTIFLLGVSVVFIWFMTFLWFTGGAWFLCALWVLAFPAIALLGFYVFALFKAAQIYDYDRKQSMKAATQT